MKKIFSRALCLLLVLVMIVGVMPMAMAAENDPPITEEDEFDTASATVVLAADKATYEEGDTVKMTLAASNVTEGYTLTSVTGSYGASYTVSGSGNSATATYPAEEGEWSLSATATFSNGTDTFTVNSNTVTVTVNKKAVTATAFKIEAAGGATSVPALGTLALSAVPTAPEGDNVVMPNDVTWTSSSSAVSFVSKTNGGCVIKGVSPTTTPVTITATSATAGTATYSVTVGKAMIDLVLTKSAFELAPGEVAQISGTYTPAITNIGNYVKVTYKSNNTSVASVDTSGKITALAAGTTTIDITLTINNRMENYQNYVFANGLTTYTKSVAVTVLNKYYIKCANQNAPVGSTVNLTPVLYGGDGRAITNATFTAVLSGYGTLNTNIGSYSVYGPRSGAVKVTFTAVGVNNDGAAVTKDVYIGFYTTSTLKVNVRDNLSSFKFSDVGFAKSATVGGSTIPVVGNDMVDLIASAMANVNDGSYYEFDMSSYSGGQLIAPNSADWTTSTKECTYASLGGVGFVQKSTSSKTSTFTITARNASVANENAVTVGMVNVEVTCGAASGIEYQTTYNVPVTFSVSDFLSYWNAQKYGTTAATTSTLNYVVFGTPSPNYGKLYTDSYRNTAVTQSMYFSPNVTVSNTTYKPLSTVTYVPDINMTSAYSVEIPFTMYGSKNDTLSGYVTIKLNDGGNTIDARGTTLGESLAAAIAQNYYTAKNQQLGYVTFNAVSAQQGTLYRSIPKSGGFSRVTLAAPVQTGDMFYYNASGAYAANQKKLSDVSIVPAAGFTGNLTIYYTAYNTTGATNSAYQGSITYTVKAKDTSAAFTDLKKHTWAIDSADFLYYEGTAQGSNGRYNPSANITRRDFMLMLYRAFLENEYGTTSVTSNFPDVVKGTDSYSQEIYQAVGVAKQLGIAQGTNNKFNPTSYITREEAMVLIYRTLDKIDRDLRYTSGTSATSFGDYSKISTWATDAIKELVSHGVIVGNNNKVNPKSNITRAEMACIRHRVITY